jgi:hypothetical protein
LHVVTGAYGYSGRYIAARLLDAGHGVRILTNAPTRRNLFGDRVAHPLCFDRPERLTALLDGASVLVRQIARAIGVRRPIISVPPRVGFLATWLLGRALGDVVLPWDEIQGLMRGLLATESLPVGHVRLSMWAREHAADLGTRYASELERRRNREVEYANARQSTR